MTREQDHHDAARLAIAVGRINRRIRPSGDGLTQGQLSALSTIVRRGPLRPGDIARIESTAPPTVTRLVAELERLGLVERVPDAADRRSLFVHGTVLGEQAILRARAERADRIGALMASLDDQQRAAIAAALSALEQMAEPGIPEE
ncbi:MarR family winged helix-turn-helix transcriptional regulator [Microbacterium sp. ASV49]|uniref:MarR family transcriptional regulator n=1 Tax=Microbacterium candidum TaxID=3041922 RepID=A0ABT7MVA2_9MICO|nr:MarR family transcriptional regulator [Microbacterium sp. ASV49]MDL9978383.1 MarR family transcriptional regulator [Microbacterium sp. ASV49]